MTRVVGGGREDFPEPRIFFAGKKTKRKKKKLPHTERETR
jgi:hypothetical protein